MFKTRGNDLFSRFPAGSCGVPEYRSTGVVEWWNVATIGIWECGFVKEGLLSNLDETPLLPLNCAYL
jgi:hypothetical protein